MRCDLAGNKWKLSNVVLCVGEPMRQGRHRTGHKHSGWIEKTEWELYKQVGNVVRKVNSNRAVLEGRRWALIKATEDDAGNVWEMGRPIWNRQG